MRFSPESIRRTVGRMAAGTNDWRDSDGNERVLYLNIWNGKRNLNSNWIENR